MIAYITTFYPAPSHTFIAREADALRGRGVEITTTSVRRAPADTVLSEEDRVAFETTDALVPARWSSVLAAHLATVIRSPRVYAAALRLALARGRPGWRGRLWQLFYFGEAVIAWRRWRRLGVRHIHAHFAAVPT